MNADFPWADVAPPPTFLIDSLHLDFPVNLIVGVALLTAVVTLILWMRRRGLRTWIAVIIGLVLYGFANFGLYVYALNQAAQNKRQTFEQHRPPSSPRSTGKLPSSSRSSVPSPTGP